MSDGGRPLPTVVRDTVRAYLEAVDAAAPGLVGGFYLVGSVALGDFRPDSSDIDFVAVVEVPPQALHNGIGTAKPGLEAAAIGILCPFNRRRDRSGSPR